MLINGLPTYDREGKKLKTALIAARASKDGELRTTNSGKEVGSISVPAYDREDGTTAWITVNGWGHWARLLAYAHKGDSILAIGRIESREYEGKNYYDLVADYVCVSSSTAEQRPSSTASAAGHFEELAEEDSDLPF